MVLSFEWLLLTQWEIAKYRGVRHFVWSNLDYALQLGVCADTDANHIWSLFGLNLILSNLP